MQNKNNPNNNYNTLDKSKNKKELNLKKPINKNKSDINNMKIGNKIEEKSTKNINKKLHNPITPLLTSKQNKHKINKNHLNTIQYNDNEIEKFFNRNGYKLNNMYSKNTKSKK